MIKLLASFREFSAVTILLAILGGVLSVFLLWDYGALIWLPFAFAITAAILHTGSAIMVWGGLSSFKAELRDAYKFICVGVIFVGFTQLQLPIISLFGWWELRENGVIIIPFVVPFIFFAIGIRRFARLLDIHSPWASPWLINSAGVLAGICLALLPHAPNNTEPLIFGFTLALLGWIATHALALIVMVLKIKKRIGVRYINAMAWLSVTYLSVLGTTLAYIVTLLTMSPGNWYLDYNISVAPFVLVGLLWVRAGYAFSAITSPVHPPNHLGAFFGPQPRKPGPYPSVDIVLYLIEQASDPKAISPLLDDMREITVKIQPGEPIPPFRQAELEKLYLQIEEYLVTKDRLRATSRKELREGVELIFSANALRNSFWPHVRMAKS